MRKQTHGRGVSPLSEKRVLAQISNRFRCYVPSKIFAVYALLFLIFLVAGLQNHIPIQHLTRDPLAITGGQFYYGLFSHVGVLLWCASAAICFFSFLVLRKSGCQLEFQFFFLASGCLNSMLLLDDLFLLHEVVFPIHLGIPEKLIFLIYGVAVSLYLVRFRRTIQKTDYTFLAIALVFLALSLSIDLIPGSSRVTHVISILLNTDGDYLLEDGAKLFGIVTWLIYFAHVAMRQVQFAAVLEK